MSEKMSVFLWFQFCIESCIFVIIIKVMTKLDVKHYLGIYKLRQEMQEEGITNPSEEVKKFTKDLVEKLSKMKLDEEIILERNSFYDSQRKLIIEFPL